MYASARVLEAKNRTQQKGTGTRFDEQKSKKIRAAKKNKQEQRERIGSTSRRQEKRCSRGAYLKQSPANDFALRREKHCKPPSGHPSGMYGEDGEVEGRREADVSRGEFIYRFVCAVFWYRACVFGCFFSSWCLTLSLSLSLFLSLCIAPIAFRSVRSEI